MVTSVCFDLTNNPFLEHRWLKQTPVNVIFSLDVQSPVGDLFSVHDLCQENISSFSVVNITCSSVKTNHVSKSDLRKLNSKLSSVGALQTFLLLILVSNSHFYLFYRTIN